MKNAQFFFFCLISMVVFPTQFSRAAPLNTPSTNAAQEFQEEQAFLKNQNLDLPRTPLPAADFSGMLQEGVTVKLSSYQNQYVFLNFWATWCVPCLKELPDMEKLHQEFGKKGLVILAVGMGESLEKIKNFAKKQKLTFPMMEDPDMKITGLYGIQNLPVTYLIDPKGVIFARAVGPREWANPELLKYFRSKVETLKSR